MNPIKNTKHIISYAFTFCALLLLIILCSCSRDAVTPPPPVIDTPARPPVDTGSKPPSDTISYVKKLEEFYFQANPNTTRRSRDFSFYYDSQNRVTHIGIKHYEIQLKFDSAATSFFYQGNSRKPHMIVTPSLLSGINGIPLLYDTTIFSYDTEGKLQNDSAMMYFYNNTGQLIKMPVIRNYAYINTSTTVVNLYSLQKENRPIELLRKDTFRINSNKEVQYYKAEFYYPDNVLANYALIEYITYSKYVNPLNKLNIGGLFFSHIYAPVLSEIFGNNSHKAIWNSNILPYHIDFVSSHIPNMYHSEGFNRDHWRLGFDQFLFSIIPWSKRNTYPEQISVSAYTALGDQCIYKYHY